MRTWRWVTRSYGSVCVRVWDGRKKPKATDGSFCGYEGHASICASQFKVCTGITVNPGDCLKVEFGKAKVISPKKKGK